MKSDRSGLIILIVIFLAATLLAPLSCDSQGSEATAPTSERASSATTSESKTTTRPVTVRTTTTTTQVKTTVPLDDPENEIPPCHESYLLPVDIYESVAPSVVSVHVSIPASSLYSKREEIFSGLIVDESGLVVTTYSLLERALDYRGVLLTNASIRIYVKGIAQAMSATIAGYQKTSDLVLLKIQDAEDTLFPALPLAPEPSLVVGSPVYCIGYPPIMIKEGGLSMGFVASLYRTTYEEDGSPVGLIETTIPSIPVYAGSPLVNQKGEVVAITSGHLKRIYVQHQGFAIPSPIVLDVIDRIVSKPQDAPVKKAGLGITILGDEDTATLREMNGYPVGLYVSLVKAESAAYTAGLNEGDILLSINGQAMEEMKDLLLFMDGLAVGTLVEMSIYRPSDDRTTTKTCYLLEEKP
ncbi:MAG TPA: S1C family serine protease [Clostridia bacterium]|nr:S1C family serine protease [Clostridia bacterium]